MRADQKTTSWKSLKVAKFGKQPNSGGIQAQDTVSVSVKSKHGLEFSIGLGR